MVKLCRLGHYSGVGPCDKLSVVTNSSVSLDVLTVTCLVVVLKTVR